MWCIAKLRKIGEFLEPTGPKRLEREILYVRPLSSRAGIANLLSMTTLEPALVSASSVGRRHLQRP